MLLPEDDFPVHQTAAPLAVAMNGHPNAYDRFFFNGLSEDFYFAIALGLYPNRGVIDGAFSVVQTADNTASLPRTRFVVASRTSALSLLK